MCGQDVHRGVARGYDHRVLPGAWLRWREDVVMGVARVTPLAMTATCTVSDGPCLPKAA